jgi:hypothetical protein
MSNNVNLLTYDFEMFTERGNQLCRGMVQEVWNRIESDKRVTLDEVYTIINAGMKIVEKSHREVHDTEPENHIEDLVNMKLKEIGYSFQVSRYDFY